jgi:hypothetical protein
VASCGDYSVLWNFRAVKMQKLNVISNGAFSVSSHYRLIPKDERVVESAFMHDRFAASQRANAFVMATQNKVWNYGDNDDDSD